MNVENHDFMVYTFKKLGSMQCLQFGRGNNDLTRLTNVHRECDIELIQVDIRNRAV